MYYLNNDLMDGREVCICPKGRHVEIEETPRRKGPEVEAHLVYSRNVANVTGAEQ